MTNIKSQIASKYDIWNYNYDFLKKDDISLWDFFIDSEESEVRFLFAPKVYGR